jgi:histidyl-tRNA synthetase
MAQLGGADLSGIGFGIGVDRVVLAAEAEGLFTEAQADREGVDLFLVALGEESKTEVAVLLNSLRDEGISADMAYGDRALKGAMKAADKSGARYCVVLGENEISSGQALLKDMSDGSEQTVRISDLSKSVSALAAQRRD